MCVMKDLDRFHLVADVIDGFRGSERGASKASATRRLDRGRQCLNRQHFCRKSVPSGAS